jgi:hypothetical protein
MVSVPKFPPIPRSLIPRLSIIVPIGRDLAAFERTLISVLENQPADSEVLVPHDGTYEDPYQLCDEVRFVVADSKMLVNQVAVSAGEARGRYVHVLAEGICATSGWTEAALEKFEHFDAGVAAPVIRDANTEKIVAAGWSDGRDRLCKSVCRGREEIGSDSPKLVGAYLQASFWRREVIRSLADAFIGRNSLEASYAYEFLLRAAGWRCVLATECDLLCDHEILPWETSSLGRGKRLRAIRNHFCRGGWTKSLLSSAGAAIANVFRPRFVAESIGQALAPLGASKVAKQIRLDAVAICDGANRVDSMSQRKSTPTNRRAA